MPQAPADSKSRGLVVIGVLAAAVILRAWFFVAWDESYFDSDQAIVGLMAKHLSEGRAFPLFFYGQEYMLAVEAWVMAPVFALIGPSVFALRVTMTLVNVAIAIVLWWLLVRDAGLGRWSAALASAPFALAAFITSAHLVEAQGGNPEAFLWVLVIWMLQKRPLVLGATMAVAFLHREFAAYAAPALLLVQIAEAGGRRRNLVRAWALTAFAFVVVFGGVNALKPHADLMGPGTAGLPIAGQSQDNVTLLVARASVDRAALPERFRRLSTEHMPMLVGLEGFRPYLISIGSDAHVGWRELLPFVAVLALVLVAWLGIDLARRRSGHGVAFPVFLILVGAQSGFVYALTRDPSMFTFRYGLLALFLPIGTGALLLQPWRPTALRAASAAVLGLLAATSAVDHLTVIQRSRIAPPPVRFAKLASALEARGVDVARGTYWRAYVTTFLTGERVKVASIDLVRIREYRLLAEAAGAEVITIQETPCSQGERAEEVTPWFLCGGH